MINKEYKILVIILLIFISTPACKKKEIKNYLEEFSYKNTTSITKVVSERGKDFIYEIIYSNSDQLNKSDKNIFIELIKYKKGDKENAKKVYQKSTSSHGIILFKPRNKTIETTDLNDDEIDEFHFTYVTQTDYNQHIEVTQVSIIKNEVYLISADVPIDMDGYGYNSFFVPNIDSKYSSISSIFKTFSLRKLNEFIAKNEDKTPFIVKEKISKKSFKQYTTLFPNLSSTIRIKEKEINELKTTPISQNLTELFICNIIGSKLDCIVSPVDSETIDGIDLRNDFEAYGIIEEEKYIILLYKQNIVGYPRLIIASHQKDGQLISRIIFAGNLSDADSVNGELRDNNIYIFTRSYKYGHKGDPKYFINQEVKKYKINKNGILNLNGTLISDQLI